MLDTTSLFHLRNYFSGIFDILLEPQQTHTYEEAIMQQAADIRVSLSSTALQRLKKTLYKFIESSLFRAQLQQTFLRWTWNTYLFTRQLHPQTNLPYDRLHNKSIFHFLYEFKNFVFLNALTRDKMCTTRFFLGISILQLTSCKYRSTLHALLPIQRFKSLLQIFGLTGPSPIKPTICHVCNISICGFCCLVLRLSFS